MSHGRPIALLIGLLVGLGLVAWVTMGVTASTVFARSRPGWALAIWPWSTVAAARQAEMAAARPVPQFDVPALHDVLRRDPTNVVAVRTLALAMGAGGDAAASMRLFRYSERLSRRDLPTQLVLIESKVGRGDVAGALVHYDRALRVSREAEPLLVPILLTASADPAIARAIGDLLAPRPLWWRPFASRLLDSPATAGAIAPIFGRLRLDPDIADQHELIVKALAMLAATGRYREAAALYARSVPDRATHLVHDGGFAMAPDRALPPLDWIPATGDDLATSVEALPRGNGNALFLVTDRKAGDAARQLLVASPGRYQLSLRAGNIAGDDFERPRITLACARTAPASAMSAPFVSVTLPPADTAGRSIAVPVAIPASCPAQWLAIRSTGSLGTQGEHPWITSIALTPLR